MIANTHAPIVSGPAASVYSPSQGGLLYDKKRQSKTETRNCSSLYEDSIVSSNPPSARMRLRSRLPSRARSPRMESMCHRLVRRSRVNRAPLRGHRLPDLRRQPLSMTRSRARGRKAPGWSWTMIAADISATTSGRACLEKYLTNCPLKLWERK